MVEIIESLLPTACLVVWAGFVLMFVIDFMANCEGDENALEALDSEARVVRWAMVVIFVANVILSAFLLSEQYFKAV